jgi:hypothetical protein
MAEETRLSDAILRGLTSREPLSADVNVYGKGYTVSRHPIDPRCVLLTIQESGNDHDFIVYTGDSCVWLTYINGAVSAEVNTVEDAVASIMIGVFDY